MEKYYHSQGILQIRLFPGEKFAIGLEHPPSKRLLYFLTKRKLQPTPLFMTVEITNQNLIRLALETKFFSQICITDATKFGVLRAGVIFCPNPSWPRIDVDLGYYPRFYLGDSSQFFHLVRDAKRGKIIIDVMSHLPTTALEQISGK